MAVEKIGYQQVKGPYFHTRYLNTEIFVLGTAHVSAASVRDVLHLIDRTDPDIIAVELCTSRLKSITEKNRWRKLDILQVIRARRVYLLMSSIILSAFQKKMGEMNRVKPGQELVTAVDEARRRKIPLELIDRDIQITLRRAWQSMGYWGKMRIFSELLVSLFVPAETESADIERMKRRDMLEEVFTELPPRFDRIRQIIITERDKFLAQKIKEAVRRRPRARHMVAVVGAGHLPGIERHFTGEHSISELEFVKPKSKWVGVLKFILPIVIISALFSYFTDFGDRDQVMNNLFTWVWVKAFCSGFLALIFLAHPLAILAAALTAPISNFNPVLKPGWVASFIEAYFRRPQVSDFENIATDSETLRGLFRNKVIRIFSLFTFPQLGSSIGTGLALYLISQ